MNIQWNTSSTRVEAEKLFFYFFAFSVFRKLNKKFPMIDVRIAWYIDMKFIIIHQLRSSTFIELLFWLLSSEKCHWNQINFVEWL